MSFPAVTFFEYNVLDFTERVSFLFTHRSRTMSLRRRGALLIFGLSFLILNDKIVSKQQDTNR